MAAKRQAKFRNIWSEDTAAKTNLTAAGPLHRDVPSPAMLLQNRVGAALAASDGAYALEPVVDKWPAATRLVILFGAASASWLIVWEVAKYLI